MSRMQFILNIIACFINIFILAVGQVPPGVNPSHYQQQYQPVEQQYQQQQFQQPPPPPAPQQQQQPQYHPPPTPQQYQQPPQPHQQQGHGHHHEPQLLNAVNIGQEREHIKEHLDVPIDTSKMSEKELHYHYFTMHDSDKNNKLDGCELIKSLIHWHEQGKDPQTGHAPQPDKIFKDEELIALIDPILEMDDVNRDGFIDYPEFVRAQLKAAKNQQQQQPQP